MEEFLKSADASQLAESGVDSMGLVRVFNKAFEHELVVAEYAPVPSNRKPRSGRVGMGWDGDTHDLVGASAN